ncbi:hypothetical protein B0H10DRAFT_1941820 [Mycena sp. CBHHK59/15]|nr:hypothetical protein B0H10DRAFT_1941820 [Mycena sp. CBHHK59/15]
MSSRSETGEWGAHDKNSNEECDCHEYQDSSDIPGFCSNCYHHHEHHLLSKPGALAKPQGVQNLLADILRKREPSKQKASSSSGGSSSLGAILAASSGRKMLGGLVAANRESNRGMRPPSESQNQSKNLKGKGKKWDSNTTNTKFKVLSVTVIPHGTTFVDGILQLPEGHDKVLDRVQIQIAVLNGLAVVKPEGIEIDRSWSHKDLVEAFHNLLPLPFEYFDKVQRDADPDDESAWQPWLLATVVQRKLAIAPITYPQGSDVEFNKGNSTTGFRNCCVFLGVYYTNVAPLLPLFLDLA